MADEFEPDRVATGEDLAALLGKMAGVSSNTNNTTTNNNTNNASDGADDEESSSESGPDLPRASMVKTESGVSEGTAGKARGVKDFSFGETIGEGSFGRVVEAVELDTGNRWAIKILEKKHILKENKVKYVKAERNILNMLNHENVIKLYCTFQDMQNLYLVLELAEGGELFTHIRRVGPESARFFAAELVHVLEYLEGQGIVHRDLKPENILLDGRGHIKLTDFGTAKMTSEVSLSRNTFCGTPEYVSPEVLRDQEATKAADLWALGCVIFQLVAHRPPFKADSEYLLFQKILAVEFDFPEGFPEDAKDLVKKLLVLDPAARLGMGGDGYGEIRRHPYFAGLDFAKLATMTPPELLPASAAAEGERPKNAPPQGVGASAAPNEARAKLIDAQKLLPWNKFVFPNELIVKHGLVTKRKGLSVKKRQLVLTDYPRIFYVDPEAMVKKGDIPWSANLKVTLKGERGFLIHTPQRTYKLEASESTNTEWVDAISSLQALTQKVPRVSEGAQTSPTK
jgi:3-phosphoinositide dependent protein kinase-1